MVPTYSLPPEGADTAGAGVDTGVLPEGADTVVDTAAEAAEPASEAVEAVEAAEAAAEEAAVSGLAVYGSARELNQPLRHVPPTLSKRLSVEFRMKEHCPRHTVDNALDGIWFHVHSM